LGHTEIAYVGDRLGLESNADRLAGYRKALRTAKIAPRRGFSIEGDGKPEGGITAARALWELPRKPTAIFCYNDMTAMGVLRAANECGWDVPRQLSVVGFDDLFFAPMLNPPLTTIHQPRQEIGRVAMRLLLALLEGRPAEKTIRIRGDLVVRGSTAKPASRRYQSI